MDKIFEEETVKYLKTFGISDKEIFKIKKDKLKDYAIQKLSLAIEAVKKEDFSLIAKDTFESAAGWGSDTCLNFGGIKDSVLNIAELFCEMQYYKEIIEGKRMEDKYGNYELIEEKEEE
jgi:hypothetical protein